MPDFDQIRRDAATAERERIIGILNRPSRDMHDEMCASGPGEIWWAENFLAKHLAPKP